MKLYMVRDGDRWGWSHNIVQASSADEARQLAAPRSRPEMVTVEELPSPTGPAILWTYDESPDTGPE